MKTKLISDENIFTIVLGTLASMFVYLVGGIDELFIAVIIFVSLDIVTGLGAALYRKEVNSRIMYWGLVRKGVLITLVIVAHQFDVISGNTAGFMRNAMMLFIIGTEGISIFENYIKLNLPVPEFVVDAFARLKGKRIKGEELKKVVDEDLNREEEVKKNGQQKEN